jgi:glycosyltransferase involved in cell wall biosynthesis
MRDWLIVAGGVRRAGGQDRANLELVRYLAETVGRRVTVVANRVDPEVLAFPNVRVRLVHPPFGSNLIGELLLRAEARDAQRLLPPNAIGLANGGNHTSARVNWVHCVHAAWHTRDGGAPPWRRVLARAKKAAARRHERKAMADAELIVANSRKTAIDLRRLLGIPEERISVVYFGAEQSSDQDPEVGPRYRIGFVGALGWDRNKGLDTALKAFARSVKELDNRYRLVVAGVGATVPWQREVERLGLRDRVDFLGFVPDLRTLFRSLDLLLSPVRYEAYGLAVQEALVEGVPVLVSADAGVAERMSSVPRFLVTEKEDPRAWSEEVVSMTRDLERARADARKLGDELGRRSWGQMAKELMEIAEDRLKG